MSEADGAGGARGVYPAGPVWPGYFADPFVLPLPDGTFAAYGSGPPPDPSDGPRVFECLLSADLRTWTSAGYVLDRMDPACGTDYWAPEVIHADGAYWMYYSVGHGISGHQLRVARASSATGPFRDVGVNLSPAQTFAIDPHPFRDDDGQLYLFFARDVLDHPRPGTHIAVMPLAGPATPGGPVVEVLHPDADWQIYERDREMYGRRYDWHTLEGPAVLRRHGRYWMTYSGGAWTGPGYAVSWASAPHPLGPWTHAPQGTPPLLATGGDLIGPGHNSLVPTPIGDVIAFHAWDVERRRRQLHVQGLDVGPAGLRLRATEPGY